MYEGEYSSIKGGKWWQGKALLEKL